MNRISTKIVAVISMLFLANSAHAGLMIEPYVGAETASASAKFNLVPIVFKGSGGTVVGARLGYKMLLPLWIAADYSLSTGKMKYDLTGFESTYNRTNSYLTVGFDFPILIRFWGGVGVGGSTKFDSGSGEDTYSGGSAMKAGIGLSLIPFTSLNVEYLSIKRDAPAGFTDYEENAVQIGLSVPFNI